jgi:cell division protein FtsI/penicillin-binding protein 2
MAARFFLSRMRMQLLTLSICLVWIAIAGRLVHIQLIKGDQFAQISRDQSKGEIILPAERGRLIDDKGRLLASNIACKSFFAYPQNGANARKIAASVAPLMSVSTSSLSRKLSSNLDAFNWLCRKIPDDRASWLEGKEIPGLFCQREMKRIYPYGGLGLDLIGTVDIDNQGISGLEYAINDRLAGHNGKALIERDAVGKVYRVSSREIVPPENGCDVALTIDLDWQEVVESELAAGVKEFNADAGMAVFLKPNDGAILAMASCCPNQQQGQTMKNEAISNLFEPGSVFKLITASAVLEEGVVRPDDIFDCDSGRAVFSNRVIRDDKKWGLLNFRNIFRVSSNIGVGKAALKLGGRHLYKYVRNFGFGSRIDIDLPGEAGGLVRQPEVWSDHYTASLAMGHGISVNSLQLATAFSVVPANGILYKPYIIKEIISSEGEILQTGKPCQVRRLISPETCQTLREFLASVVDSGTAKYSRSKRVSFCGKTGTAQKPNLETGGYYQNRFMSSFAGYFPRENPVAVGVIVFDNAQPLHYAGMTAARVFARVAERIASLKQLPAPRPTQPEVDSPTMKLVSVPNFIGSTRSGIKEALSNLNLDVKIINDGDTVIRQHPAAGAELAAGERLLLYCGDENAEDKGKLTDVLGLSVRQAIARLTNWGYEVELQGSGLVRGVRELKSSGDGVCKRCQIFCGMD